MTNNYYIESPIEGPPRAVVRSHWPDNTETEIWTSPQTGWRNVDMFETVNNDPDWEPSDEATINAFITAKGGTA